MPGLSASSTAFLVVIYCYQLLILVRNVFSLLYCILGLSICPTVLSIFDVTCKLQLDLAGVYGTYLYRYIFYIRVHFQTH